MFAAKLWVLLAVPPDAAKACAVPPELPKA